MTAAVLHTPSPFLILPAALEALEGHSSASGLNARLLTKPLTFANTTSVASSKRTRELDTFSDVQPHKAVKTGKFRGRPGFASIQNQSAPRAAGTSSTPSGVERLVDEYMKKHPVAGEVQAEDQELLCTCLQPQDDRAMIACANGDSCRLRWYHLECLGMASEDLPGDNGESSNPHLSKRSLTIL